MKLDLSKYKKLMTTHDHTVMMHPKGHKIRVDHDSLDESTRKLIHDHPFHKEEPQHLAEGG